MTTMTQNDTQCKLTHNALQCHHLKKLNLLKAPSLALQSLDDFKLQRFSKLDCTLAKSYPLHSPTWRRLQAKTLQTLWLFQDPSNPVTLQTHVQTFGLFKDSSSPCTPTPQSFQQLQVQLKVHVQAGWLQRLLKQILKRQTLKAALPAMWCANVLICFLNSQANQLKETSNPLITLKPQTIWGC